MPTFAYTIGIATTVLTAASMAYCLLVLWSAASFRRYARGFVRLPEFAPGVSILKPVKGFDDGMYEAFRSHCLQQYAGEFELIFGAGSESDPAVAAVHRLQAEFPDRAIKLVICPERLGSNGKVSNLIQMLPQAKHPFLLVNDSDIRVSPLYLERVMRQFAAPAQKPVGMVTALYRGRAARTAAGGLKLGSIFESMGIATDFQAGVLVARVVESGIHFGLGSTLCMRREALAAAGGFEALVDQLADDYEMGVRVDAAGYSIRLATEVVETSIPAYGLSGFWSHQLRWARTVRDSRRWGYLLRLAIALQVGVGTLRDMQVLRDLWLLPLRDLVGFAVWIWSFAGNTIEWRGERFLLKDGKLTKTVS
jgi:ceramide glucosyltransferase